VRNFMNFGPVGIILVVMIGVGLAEQAGLMTALIKKIVQVTPHKAVTWILVTLGVLASVAADAGYLVLIPLGAAAFLSLGRHPLAGLAAAFSGVAAVFGVNFLIIPLDPVLTEITNDAIHLLNPTLSIDLAANFYFGVVSSLVLIVVCALVTERIVEPRLGKYRGEIPAENAHGVSAQESRGLRWALYALVASIVVIGLLTFPPGAPLRDPETGAIIGNSPFMNSLIVQIMLVFLAIGAAYGVGAGTITSMVDGINAVTKTFSGLSGLIFLLFVISQFLAYFTYSNMATIVAVKMGDAPRARQSRHDPIDARVHHREWRRRLADRRGDPEMGAARADLRAALHEAGCCPGGRVSRLPRSRFAAKCRHPADALFRTDRHLCAAI